MPPSHLSQSAKPLSGRYLSFEEREKIALLRAQGRGIRHIACRLERAPSTISREVRRNAATRSGGLDYRATTAQWHADRSAKRPKPAKLATNEALRRYVQDRLAGRISAPDGTVIEGPRVVWNGRRHGPRQHRRWARAWSPEQIAHRLRIDYPGDGPEDQAMRISHEAIYRALYVQGRGALRRELTACLRTGRALRVPRARSRRRGKSFVTPEIMISERSAEAADRARTRTLGRRPDHRLGQIGDRHSGGTRHAVHNAAASSPNGRPRHRPAREERACACRSWG